jgi:hypothetical protein
MMGMLVEKCTAGGGDGDCRLAGFWFGQWEIQRIESRSGQSPGSSHNLGDSVINQKQKRQDQHCEWCSGYAESGGDAGMMPSSCSVSVTVDVERRIRQTTTVYIAFENYFTDRFARKTVTSVSQTTCPPTHWRSRPFCWSRHLSAAAGCTRARTGP